MKKTDLFSEGYFRCKFADKFDEEFTEFCDKENIEHNFIDSVNDSGMLYHIYDVYIGNESDYDKVTEQANNLSFILEKV